jgi:hypothetical protein
MAWRTCLSFSRESVEMSEPIFLLTLPECGQN